MNAGGTAQKKLLLSEIFYTGHNAYAGSSKTKNREKNFIFILENSAYRIAKKQVQALVLEVERYW